MIGLKNGSIIWGNDIMPPDHGEWHGQALCKLTKQLMDLDIEIYSECMTPELEFIKLGGRILGKTPGKLGISLFLDTKSLETRLTKPDMVIVKDNKIQHIIEVEESKNPIEIAGMIVATRVAVICDVNSDKISNRPFPVKDAVLHILFKDWVTPNVQASIDDVKTNIGNLSEINIQKFDDFINNQNYLQIS